MNRTRIDWADFSWNPVKGICPEDCKLPDGKSYCYGRRLYRRFKMDAKPRFDLGEIWKPVLIKKPSRIFVCSTFELFHPDVRVEWRDWIFTTIKAAPRHTFIILTKRPERIDRAMPDNVWLGTSITTAHDMWRIEKLFEALAVTRFVSFEPLLDPARNFQEHLSGVKRNMLDWIIVGRLTGHGKKCDPERDWVEQLVSVSRFYRLPIFMKNNLKDIWPGPLIQEYPKETP